MSNKEQAAALMAVAGDQDRARPERQAAWNELNELKRKAKTSFEKLGATEAWRNAVMAQLVAVDDGFEMSEEELAAQKPRQELARDPLDEETVTEQPEITEADRAEANAEIVRRDEAKAKAPKELTDADRGAISLTVRHLLTKTESPYADIVAQVLAKHPHATTTTRSVASVASEMRAKGEEVPTRRVAAKPKAAK